MKQLDDLLKLNDLSETYPSAYRSGNSTESALLRVSSDILQAVDNGKALYLVLLDLSAAFDTMDYHAL